MSVFDSRYDTDQPTPELIREFVGELGQAFASARAYPPAAATLAAYGEAYLTEAEVSAIRQWGTAAERLAVSDR